ncbi:MAG: DUF2955 domain-containing protein [Pararheinheimera sp.]|nr:DUF2955 domain-containing protein [Rheinheimera sp.]
MFAPTAFNKVLRLAFGASLGLLLAKLTNSDQWGVFFTISPVLLLGLIPRLTPFVVLQYVSANLLAGAMVLLYSWLGALSAVMTLLVFIYFLWLFRLMAKGALFVFAAIAIINGSIFLHFASYPSMDPGQMLGNALLAVLFALLISGAVIWLFPVPEQSIQMPPAKTPLEQQQQSLVAAAIATLSFVTFQLLDLQDSLSAQASSILILLPMSFTGIVQAGIKRASGVLLGSAYAIAVQLVLYDNYQHLALTMLAFFFGMLIFARAQQLEGPGSGVAFGGMTTMAIIFGQYLKPDQDLMYSALYRISSVSVAVVLTLVLATVLYLQLERRNLKINANKKAPLISD